MPRLTFHSVHHFKYTESALACIYDVEYDPNTNHDIFSDDPQKQKLLISYVKRNIFYLVKQALDLTQYRAMEVVGGEMGDMNVYINIYPHTGMQMTAENISNLNTLLKNFVAENNRQAEERHEDPKAAIHKFFKKKNLAANEPKNEDEKYLRKS